MDNYRRAREVAPADPVAYYNIAVLLHEQGKLAEAEASYRKALQLNPSHTSALLNLGSLLAGRGEADEAVSLLEEAVHQMPRNPTAHLALGAALGLKGDRDRAIEQPERAIELAPRNPAAYRLLGDTLESAGRLTEAEETLRKSLPMLTANDGATLASFIRVLLRQGKDTEAERLLEQTVRVPPSPLRTHAFQLSNLLALHPWDQTAVPPIPAPAAGLADLAAYCRKELSFDASAARLYLWAFAADPHLLRTGPARRSLRALRAGKGLGMTAPDWQSTALP